MLGDLFNTERSSQQFNRDTRALSVTIDHALGILILLTIVSIFIGSVATIHDDRQTAVTEQELDRISEEVATTVISADELAETGEQRQLSTSDDDDVTATTRASLPSTVTGDGYTVQIDEADAGEDVTITVSTHSESVETTVSLDNDIESLSGTGDLIVQYDDEDEELTMETV